MKHYSFLLENYSNTDLKYHRNELVIEILISYMVQSAKMIQNKKFCNIFKYSNPANYNKYAGASNGLMYNTFVDIYQKMRKLYINEFSNLNNPKIIKLCKFLSNTNFTKINDDYKFSNDILKSIHMKTKQELDSKIFN